MIWLCFRSRRHHTFISILVLHDEQFWLTIVAVVAKDLEEEDYGERFGQFASEYRRVTWLLVCVLEGTSRWRRASRGIKISHKKWVRDGDSWPKANRTGAYWQEFLRFYMMLFFSFRETNKAFLSLAAENSPSMCCTEDNYDRKLSAGAESALCRLSSSKPTTVVERRRVQQFMRNQKKTPACLPTLAKLAIIIPRRDLLD